MIEASQPISGSTAVAISTGLVEQVGKFPGSWTTNATELDDNASGPRGLERRSKRHSIGLRARLKRGEELRAVSAEFAGVLRQDEVSRS